jgi:hypothetical protein
MLRAMLRTTRSSALVSLAPLAASLLLSTTMGCTAQVELEGGRVGSIEPGSAPAAAESVVRVSGKWGHVCHIDAEQRLFCWGQNLSGELGVPGAAPFAPSPLPVDPEHRYREVTAGIGTTCAIRVDGSLHCWGRNHGGPLATGDTDPRVSPLQIGHDHDWEAVSIGSGLACGLRKGGKLFCWGGQDYGELLQPASLGPDALVEPTLIEGTWLAVSSHWYQTVAIAADGSLWTSDNDGVFSPLAGFEGEAAQVSVGVLYALVVDRKGALFHLDFSDSTEALVTPELPDLTFGGPMGSAYGACSISSDRQLYCTNDLLYEIPQLAPLGEGLPRWTGVGVGNRFGCATAEDDSLWCWGTLHSDSGAASRVYGETPVRVE